MEYKVIKVQPKKLVGKSLSMSFFEDMTAQLWGSFAPQMAAIPDRVGGEKISLQFYSDDFMSNPTNPFIKWATVEVSDFKNTPETIQQLEIQAVYMPYFITKGVFWEHLIFLEKYSLI